MKQQKIWFSLTLCSLLILLTISGCSYFLPQKEAVPPEEDPNQIGELSKEGPDPEKEFDSPEIGDGPEKDHRELTMENIVQIYGDTIFRFGRRKPMTVALTFDDGPDHQFTPQILDVLKEYNVKATFFLTGIRTVQAIDVLKRIDQEGHEVAHHGYNHLKMSNLTPEEIRDELAKLNALFQEHLGKKSYLFRPPYGAIDPELVETVKADGFYIILWDIDTLDWRSLNKEEVLANVMPNLHSGAIVLQHSAGGPGEDLTGTVQALPEIIRNFRARGFRFVTISEMFAQEMGLEQVEMPMEGTRQLPGQMPRHQQQVPWSGTGQQVEQVPEPGQPQSQDQSQDQTPEQGQTQEQPSQQQPAQGTEQSPEQGQSQSQEQQSTQTSEQTKTPQP